MRMVDPYGDSHPEDLLSPYALDTLSEEEALGVEVHLESCQACREEAASLRETAAWLSASVAAQVPPPALQSRLMASVDPGVRPPVPAPVPAPEVRYAPRPRARFLSPRLLVPMAVALVLLLAASITMNLWYDRQVDQLTQEQANLTARVLNMADDDTRLVSYLEESEVASYLMENPSNEPLMLMPPGGNGDPQGVLLFAEDSRHAVLLIANMSYPEAPGKYQVWLWRSGQRVRMGEVDVNQRGWGILALYYPQESVLRFDKVFLRKPGLDTNGSEPGDMVLEGTISAVRTKD